MAESYTRQASFAEGDVILADHGNLEFNQIVRAMNELTGHNHDGTVAAGAAVPLLRDPSNTHDLTLTPEGITGSVIDTDVTLTANSDTRIPSQKAVRAFIAEGNDRLISPSGSSTFILDDAGVTSTHINDDSNLTSNSTVKLVTERAIKEALDTKSNLVSSGQDINVGAAGLTGSVIELDNSLPTTAVTTVPTTLAVKEFVEAKDTAQSVALAAQASSDTAARNAIIATADTDRAQVAVDIDSAITTSEAKPHIGTLQDAAVSPASKVVVTATSATTTGLAVTSQAQGVNAVNTLSSVGTGGDILVTAEDKVDISTTTGDVNLGAAQDINLDAATKVTVTSPSLVVNGIISGSAISTDTSMASNSDSLIPTQRAAKTYVDNLIATSSAPVNTASVNITGSTTELASTSLTLDGPASDSLGGRINLQAGTTDTSTADVFIQKIDDAVVLGTDTTINHTLNPLDVTFNRGSTIITDTTSTLPGYSWNGTQAVVGSLDVFYASSSSATLLQGTPNAKVIIDSAKVSLLGDKVNLQGNNTYLNDGNVTFSNTIASLNSGNTSISDNTTDTYITKEAGGGSVNVRNTQSNQDVYLSAAKGTLPQVTIAAYGGASGTWADLRFNELTRAYTQNTGLFVRGSDNSSEIRLEHIGTAGYLTNVTIGDLNVVNAASGGDIHFSNDQPNGTSQLSMSVVSNSLGNYVSLKKGGAERLRTESEGITIPGSTNNRVYVGHNGTYGYIANIDNGDLHVRNTTTGSNILLGVDDTSGVYHDVIKISGTVTPYASLYFDGNEKLATTSAGIEVVDGAFTMSLNKTAGGDGGVINYNSGELLLRNDVSGQAVYVQARNGGGTLQNSVVASAADVSLRAEGREALKTTSTGVRLFGTSQYVFDLYHDGSSQYLQNYTGDYNLYNSAAGKAIATYVANSVGAVQKSIQATGGVGFTRAELYYSNTKVMETDASGIVVGNAAVGTCQIGPKNATYNHFTTDRPSHYFNKEVVVEGTGGVRDYSGHWGLEDSQLTLGSGRRAVRDPSDGFLYLGDDFTNGVYTTKPIRSDNSLQVGINGVNANITTTGMTLGSSGSTLNIGASSATTRGYDIVNRVINNISAGTFATGDYSDALHLEYVTWTGAYIFNLEATAPMANGKTIVINKNNSTSTMTINATASHFYGPWDTTTNQLNIPAGTHGSVTIKKVAATVLMVTLNLTNLD